MKLWYVRMYVMWYGPVWRCGVLVQYNVVRCGEVCGVMCGVVWASVGVWWGGQWSVVWSGEGCGVWWGGRGVWCVVWCVMCGVVCGVVCGVRCVVWCQSLPTPDSPVQTTS